MSHVIVKPAEMQSASLLDRAFWVLTDLFWCLRPMRMSILVLVLGFFVIAVADQGTDALRLLDEDGKWWPLFTGVLFWAVNTWYAARVVGELKFRPEPEKGSAERRRLLLEWLPRLLGIAVFLAVAWAMSKARVNIWVIGLDLILGAVFALFVWRRRALSRRLGIAVNNLAGFRGLSLSTAGWPTRAFIIAQILFSCALFLAAIYNPIGIGRTLTPGAIYLFASATWIPLGTILVVFGERYRLPVFALVAGLMLLFSLTNDNHAIRPGPNVPNATRPTIAEAYKEWLENWNLHHVGEVPRPVVVATYGGGIRAAYWTAMVLARLETRIPDFRDRLFAISGVSGGAVGAVAYRALLADPKTLAPDEDLGGEDYLSYRVDKVLGEDYLGPIFATMFYPDLAQRFLPVPMFKDRALSMERAWESAWGADSAYNKAFLDLWKQTDRGYWQGGKPWPALFLNGTSVNDGSRLVTSNLLPSDSIKPYRDFIDEFGANLYAATAASNSARFPLVLPAGTFRVEGAIDQIVDGGYYDNSGADTAFNIISELRNKGEGKHEIVAIVINSDVGGESPVPSHAKGEAGSIITALLNTRNAHTEEAVGQLQWTVEAGEKDPSGVARFARVMLSDLGSGCGSGEPPLGWVLSRASRETMKCRPTQAVESAVEVIAKLKR